MTNLVRTELEAAIAAKLPDNTSQDITAADLRAACTDLNDTIFREDAIALSDKTGRIMLQQGGYLLRDFATDGFPVVVESWEASDTGGAAPTSITLTAPSGITSGDLLILCVVADISSGQWTGTPPQGPWTQLWNYGMNFAALTVYYKIADGTETDVVVSVQQTCQQAGWYLRVSGVDQTTPINVYNVTPASQYLTDTLDIPEVTTNADNCLAFYFMSYDGGDGTPFSVAGAGWSQTDEHNSGTGSNDSCGCWGTKEHATAGATGDAAVTAALADGMTGVQFAVAPA